MFLLLNNIYLMAPSGRWDYFTHLKTCHLYHVVIFLCCHYLKMVLISFSKVNIQISLFPKILLILFSKMNIQIPLFPKILPCYPIYDLMNDMGWRKYHSKDGYAWICRKMEYSLNKNTFRSEKTLLVFFELSS